MPPEEPYNIYREQLSSHYRGHALWHPNPVESLFKDPCHVSIGDVGYLDNGAFMRIFNVCLPRDDPSNNTLIQIPDGYKPLKREHFENVRRHEVRQEEFQSHLSKVDNVRANTHDEDQGQTYECWPQGHGALLSLPYGARSEDVIRTKLFEDYIRDNVDSWLRWSKEEHLPVENTEDLILVTGCTLTKPWAAAAFDSTVSRGEDATAISLEARKSDGGGAQFVWRNIRGNVDHQHSDSNIETLENQCVFIKGFRAKRRFFWIKHLRAAAEPLPDEPYNRRGDEMQVSQIPGGPKSKYRDPLVGVLDYIVENCGEGVSASEDIIAIAHDDDLQLIEGVETLTADAVENFLREKKVPLLVENGAAILRDPADTEPPVSDERKAIFYAADLNGGPVQLDIHPVLTKYLLKLEATESPDYDYDLPNEEMASPAVYPHTRTLRLEYSQGYPQVIIVDASGDSQGAEVTVQDVLRTIHEDLRKPSSKRELGTFARGDQNAIRDTFRKRCKSEEERSKGLYRVDYLRGRDRLQILPRHPLDGTSLPASALAIQDQSNVAGPSSIPAS